MICHETAPIGKKQDISSEMPTSNVTWVQDVNMKGVFKSNGFVTYVPTIQDLYGIVNQLTSYLSTATVILAS